MPSNPSEYQKSGVNIDAGNELVERIKPIVKRTMRKEIFEGFGGFSAMFKIPKHYADPVLVTSTDGVGTKLKIAIDLNRHQKIGIDLVAMCVNDLVVCGAEPLAFLDYYATGELNVDAATSVVEGIAEGCIQAGCSLIGGETAEMPGMYQPQDYDLAGFTIGVVEENKVISGQQIQNQDVLIGLASSGPHSNGYSLIRKLIQDAGFDFDSHVDGKDLSNHLLEPTRIYVKPVLEVLKTTPIKGMVHVTGGGFYENIPRMLPSGLGADINTQAWETPWFFQWLASLSKVSHQELYRTFNMGIGFILCVSADMADSVVQQLNQLGEKASIIGQITDQDEIRVLK